MYRFKILKEEVLSELHLSVLREIGRVIGVRSPASRKKEELIEDILAIQNGKLTPEPPSNRGAPPKLKIDLSEFMYEEKDPNTPYPDKDPNSELLIFHDSGALDRSTCLHVEGVFDKVSNTYGFLRVNRYENSSGDVYVSNNIIKKYNIKVGDLVKGYAKVQKEGDSPAILEVETIQNINAIEFKNRKEFDNITPCYPDKKMDLYSQAGGNDISLRCIDYFTPIGFGQRGLIVAPPKTGKTTILQKIAKSIEQNDIGVSLFILLIDERPEEVTDFKRCIKDGEVVASTFDQAPEHHIKTVELLFNRAKRLVEQGRDVIILMDSITRLVRAYNNTIESSGKTLSGGLDPTALISPKKFFGAARNLEGAGSLTIIATALVDTGSRMDDVIYEEFKGTGNMEIYLSRKLADRRIFPAIDIIKSGTRKDELLLNGDEQLIANTLRRIAYQKEDSEIAIYNLLSKCKNDYEILKKLEQFEKVNEK